MSYDLMVFNPLKAPRDRQEFMKWYLKETEWTGYSSDHQHTQENLKSWLLEMAGVFPPMNGPLMSDDVDNPKIADYSIGENAVYVTFSWTEAASAYETARVLAMKHMVGFFDVSSENGEIIFPDEFQEKDLGENFGA